jgi:hypothetical protein
MRVMVRRVAADGQAGWRQRGAGLNAGGAAGESV